MVDLEFHEEIGSTQTRAKALTAESTAETPQLVLAARQTAGRGRGANTWWAGPGAITFSWTIDPQAYGVAPSRWASASVAVALGICKELETIVSPVGLKWPNDVFVQGRKVCGVLVETVAGHGNPRMIIGVGVNVNNTFANAPPEIANLGTSLIDLVGRPFERTGVLLELLQQIDHELKRLGAADDRQAIEWNERSLLTDRDLELETPSGPIAGRCIGVDPEGALLLSDDSTVIRLVSGVVKRISPPL